MQMASTFGVHVTHLGFSAATYGALISMNGALVVLCELPLTTITRRFPARRVLAAGYLLIGLGFALNAFAHTVPALAAASSSLRSAKWWPCRCRRPMSPISRPPICGDVTWA